MRKETKASPLHAVTENHLRLEERLAYCPSHWFSSLKLVLWWDSAACSNRCSSSAPRRFFLWLGSCRPDQVPASTEETDVAGAARDDTIGSDGQIPPPGAERSPFPGRCQSQCLGQDWEHHWRP